MNKTKGKQMGWNIFLILILILIDQLTKYWAVIRLKGHESIPLIKNVLHLQYLENRGAAFGLLQNQKWFIIFIGIIFLAIFIFLMIKLPLDKKYTKLQIVFCMTISGALGNMIDRIRCDYVIDFIYFIIIDFPIFNFADICVTISVVLCIIFLLFVYKEDDFDFLNFKQRKYREVK